MKAIDVIAAVLLVIGGLNWGLWGIFQFDLVAAIFGGNDTAWSRIIYTLVGIAAVYDILAIKAIMARWHGKPAAAPVA